MSENSGSTPKLQRRLKNRHIQMIALGSAIGIGFFYGSGQAIAIAGPAVLVSYLIGGLFIYLIMRMLGEMIAQEPVAGSFSHFAYQYWGDFAGFLSGWNYWFLYVLIGITELTVIGIYLDHWVQIPHWQTAFIVLAVVTIINLVAVRLFGEFEFWFSGIKVLAVIGMIVLGLFLILTGTGGNSSGIANLWDNGGFAPFGISGIIMGLVVVMFSFGGAELVGIAAAEADQPEKVIPKALQQFMWRILLFYLASTAIIMILLPWDGINDASGSPFVTVFDKIGIKSAAGIFNLVVITAAISVYNSGAYSNGRMLYSLAKQGNAPRVFARLNKRYVPYIAVLFSCLCTALGLVMYYTMSEGAFMRILAVVTSAAIVTWGIIVYVHLKFRRAYNLKLSKDSSTRSLVFKSPFYPISNYLCLIFLVGLFILMLLTGFTEDGFLTDVFHLKQPLLSLPVPDVSLSALIVPVWILLLYIGFCIKNVSKTHHKD